MLTGMACRVGVERRFPQDAPLLGFRLDHCIRPADHGIEYRVHIAGLGLLKFMEYIPDVYKRQGLIS